MDNEEISYLDSELLDVCSDIKRSLKELDQPVGKRLTSKRKAELNQKVTEKINRAKHLFGLFKAELKELGRDEMIIYEQKAADHNTTLVEIVNELNLLKSGVERAELMAGNAKEKEEEAAAEASAQGGGAAKGAGTEEKKERGPNAHSQDADDVIKEGMDIHNQSKASLGRSLKLVAMSEEVGTAAANQLKAQGEQLRGVNDKMDKIQDNLDRAKDLMKNFGDGLIRDPCFIVLGVLLLLLIGGAVLVKLTQKNEEDATSIPGGTPEPSSRSSSPTLWSFLAGPS